MTKEPRPEIRSLRGRAFAAKLQRRVLLFFQRNAYCVDTFDDVGGAMRILLSIFLVAWSTSSALAWRCTDPDRPKCPDGVCVHDPKLKSDYCAKGFTNSDTMLGPSVTVTSPGAAASMRRLKTK